MEFHCDILQVEIVKPVAVDFADFAAADRIVATSNLNRKLAAVEDAERIHAVLAVLGRHTTGWGVPADGIPVASTRLNFYQGDRLLGHVGVGRMFLTALYRGNFWSRSSEAKVSQDLLDLLGLTFGADRQG